MNKKKIIIISICVVIFIIAIILLDLYYPSEQEFYERNMKFLEERRNLCESAGLVFEQEGEFTNPMNKVKEGYIYINSSMEERVYCKCYELRNNVKVYQNWDDMEYI